MLKKIGIGIAVIVVIALAAAGIFYMRAQAMARNINSQYDNLKPVDLKTVKDGVYAGSFGDFLVSVSVDVTVKGHKIKQIKITNQKCGPGYEALGTVDRILKAQSAKVDAITGATGSSKCIMLAVNRALSAAASRSPKAVKPQK